MFRRFNRNFFERPTLLVAENLLGKILVRKWRGKEIRAVITETEAYCGFDDKASHVSRGITPRNKIMFGSAGFAYIYLIYGMHYCLNIVTEREGYPAAILIRGAVLLDSKLGHPTSKFDGPGKLTKALRIDKSLNGEDIITSQKLWIENSHCGNHIPVFGNVIPIVERGPRIGINYAGEWAKKPWRFWIKITSN